MVGIEWSDDADQGSWWAGRLHPMGHDVGSVVPDTFDAYARIFHPAEFDGRSLRWSDVASMTGRVVHAEMQFDPICAMADGTGRLPVESPLEGSLNRTGLDDLARLLAHHTSTPDRCWFAIWDGFGQLHGGAATAHTMFVWTEGSDHETIVHSRADPLLDPSRLAGPRVHAPGRDYYLATGALGDLDDFYDQVGHQSPNVWWPEDRSWIVATEIDFCWTYVAGNRSLIDAVISHPNIEALEARTHHTITFDGDTANN